MNKSTEYGPPTKISTKIKGNLFIKLMTKLFLFKDRLIYRRKLEKGNWYKFTNNKKDKKNIYYLQYNSTISRLPYYEIACLKYFLTDAKGSGHRQQLNTIPFTTILAIFSLKHIKEVTQKELSWIKECYSKGEVLDYQTYINSKEFYMSEINDLLGL